MTSLHLASSGVISAIGHSATETYASVMAGIRRFSQTSIRGLDGERLVASLVFPVSPTCAGGQRAWSLAEPALRECMGPRLGSKRTAVLLCTPSARNLPARFEPLYAATHPTQRDWPGELLSRVSETCEHKYLHTVSETRIFGQGRIAGVFALQEAAALLDSGRVDACIIGSVEPTGQQCVLEKLDILGLAKSARTPNGMIFGEAACFLYLERAEATTQARRAIVHTEGHVDATPTSQTARGLTETVRNVLERSGTDPRSISHIISDMAGQRREAQQLTFAVMRNFWRERSLPVIIHPADRLGDVGAATTPLLCALGKITAERATSDATILVSCSAGRAHGAVTLHHKA